MPLPTEIDRLEDQYFEMLEENGISYLEYDRVSDDPPYDQVFVKDEFNLTEDEMAQELGYKNFEDWKENQHDD